MEISIFSFEFLDTLSQCVGNLGEHGYVMFCSDRAANKECHTWDGYASWNQIANHADNHHLGGLEKWGTTAIAFGGASSDGWTEKWVCIFF